MIHAAGAPVAGVSARPKALVVLVKTNRSTPAATDSSSRLSVAVTLASMNSWRVWEPTCGLCSVAVWSHGVDALQRAPGDRAVGEIADDPRCTRRQDVEPIDTRRPRAEDAHERFAEVAGASRDEDRHTY